MGHMIQEKWRKRLLRRVDMTSRLTHLTKGADSDAAFDTLWRILKEKKLSAGSGYIVGETKVVCFQETPLGSIGENLLFEEEFDGRKRYSPFGLRFNKGTLYQAGARPVFYGDSTELKRILPQDQYWRIVSLRLENANDIVDWTHEREWRHPGNLQFEYEQIEIVVDGPEYYKRLVKRCLDEERFDILTGVNGIVPLFSVVC